MISGHFYPSRLDLIQHVPAHEVINFEVSFIAALKPAIYGIQFIVRGIRKEKISNVSNLRDGILFKVIAENDNYHRKSLVNLFLSGQHSRKETRHF